MHPIVAPLNSGDQNEEVANLNSALLFLLDKGLIDTKSLEGTPNDAAYLTEVIKSNMNLYSEGTSGFIYLFRDQHDLGADGDVDSDTATALNDFLRSNGAFEEQVQYKVSGVVLNKMGEPIADQAVMALDVDLRGARIYKTVADVQGILDNQGFELLGEATTDTNGFYQISFNASSFSKAELDLADVVVYALEQHNIILGRSLLSTNKDYGGGTELKNWNITLESSALRGISEYDRLMKAVHPLMEKSNMELYELAMSADQILFLSNETGQDYTRTTLLVQADNLRNDIQTHSANEIIDYGSIRELLYGTGRQNNALNWQALAVTGSVALKNAFYASRQQNIVGLYFSDDAAEDEKRLDTYLQFLLQYATGLLLTDSDPEKNEGLPQLLNLALPDAVLQTTFLNAYTNFQGSPQQFWEEHLPAQEGFKDNPTLIPALLFTNQLSMLTGNHLPLIQELQENQKISSPHQLLGLAADQWKETLDNVGWPAGITEADKPLYITGMQNLLNAAYPTQKIAQMVQNNELPIAEPAMKSTLTAFFDQAPAFDFTLSRVTAFNDTIAAVAGDEQQKLTDQLHTMQRVFQVSPTPVAMAKLMEHNLTSAYAIANVPQESFLQQYGPELGEDIALSIHNRAAYQNLRVQNAALSLFDYTHAASFGMMRSEAGKEAIAATIKKHIPNYEELFGTAGGCECRDCRSVYSAAAYFVDIIRFLEKSMPNEAGRSPLEVLLDRRPDLAFIKLTCENTNILIPYIDLANEIMEYYVENKKLDKNAAYDTGDATAEALRANPQNFHDKAYEVLKAAVYPFSLPYNQPLDVIRTYTAQIETTYYDILEAYRNDGTEKAAYTNALAAEYLQLSAEEFEIITKKTFYESAPASIKSTFEYYGYDSLEHLTNELDAVPELLKRTGITYADLVEVIKTRFINAAQDILDYVEELLYNAAFSAKDFYDSIKQVNDGTDPSSFPILMALLTGKRISTGEFIAWVKDHFAQLGNVITLYEPSSSCDVNNTSLRTLKHIYETVLGNGFSDNDLILSRFHRFIRLWKKTGWTVHELDSLITATGETELTPVLIQQLASAKQVAGLLKISLL